MAGLKKINFSLKSKTSAFSRPYGSICLDDSSTSGFLTKLKALPLANRGKYQVSLVDQIVTEDEVQLPASGPSQAVEYQVNLTVVGADGKAYLSLPGLAASNSNELTALKSELENLARNNKIYSKEGTLIGTFDKIITNITDSPVKLQSQQVQQGGN